jgi:hypothetical protein
MCVLQINKNNTNTIEKLAKGMHRYKKEGKNGQ